MELILKLKTGQQTRKKKQEGRKRNREAMKELCLSTYKDINTSTAITELILKLNTGQQTREKRQEGRKWKKEERGYERVMPLDIQRYKYKHSNHGVHSQAEHRTTNKRK